MFVEHILLINQVFYLYECFSYEYVCTSELVQYVQYFFLCRVLVFMTRLRCVPTCADSEFSCCKTKCTVRVPVAECCRRTT